VDVIEPLNLRINKFNQLKNKESVEGTSTMEDVELHQKNYSKVMNEINQLKNKKRVEGTNTMEDVELHQKNYSNVINQLNLKDEMESFTYVSEDNGSSIFSEEDNVQTFWALHRVVVYYLGTLDKKNILKAGDLILQMLEMNTRAPYAKAEAFYQLACAKSLLGNVNEALAALENAISGGYRELDKLLNEKHFENIKNTNEFMRLIEKLLL